MSQDSAPSLNGDAGNVQTTLSTQSPSTIKKNLARKSVRAKATILLEIDDRAGGARGSSFSSGSSPPTADRATYSAPPPPSTDEDAAVRKGTLVGIRAPLLQIHSVRDPVAVAVWLLTKTN